MRGKTIKLKTRLQRCQRNKKLCNLICIPAIGCDSKTAIRSFNLCQALKSAIAFQVCFPLLQEIPVAPSPFRYGAPSHTSGRYRCQAHPVAPGHYRITDRCPLRSPFPGRYRIQLLGMGSPLSHPPQKHSAFPNFFWGGRTLPRIFFSVAFGGNLTPPEFFRGVREPNFTGGPSHTSSPQKHSGVTEFYRCPSHTPRAGTSPNVTGGPSHTSGALPNFTGGPSHTSGALPNVTGEFHRAPLTPPGRYRISPVAPLTPPGRYQISGDRWPLSHLRGVTERGARTTAPGHVSPHASLFRITKVKPRESLSLDLLGRYTNRGVTHYRSRQHEA